MKTIAKKTAPKQLAKNAGNSNIAEKKKDFDAVKTMRQIRDKLSKEIMEMTFEEENAYLQKLIAKKTA